MPIEQKEGVADDDAVELANGWRLVDAYYVGSETLAVVLLQPPKRWGATLEYVRHERKLVRRAVRVFPWRHMPPPAAEEVSDRVLTSLPADQDILIASGILDEPSGRSGNLRGSRLTPREYAEFALLVEEESAAGNQPRRPWRKRVADREHVSEPAVRRRIGEAVRAGVLKHGGPNAFLTTERARAVLAGEDHVTLARELLDTLALAQARPDDFAPVLLSELAHAVDVAVETGEPLDLWPIAALGRWHLDRQE